MSLLLRVVISLIYSFVIMGREITINHESYEQALAATTKVYFKMESTKVGFITTEFIGVVKNGKISYDQDENSFRNVTFKFKVVDLDTDMEARNEKMWTLCFEISKFPEAEVNFSLINGSDSQVQGVIKLRGESYPITINYKIENNFLKFNSKISLKEFNIPDPSIFIAKVNDEIKLFGEISLE